MARDTGGGVAVTPQDAVDARSFTFTVFTPTYNRGHTLERVYQSLCRQSFHDFEWLIVDDGSTDDTQERVLAWRQAASFPIVYVRQTNQGKHVATNRAVQRARGELFLTLDSDDSCVPTALERLLHHWKSIPDEARTGFSAVTCLCVDETGEVVGSLFPQDPTDSDSIEIRYRYRVTGEKWGFQRTDVMRQFPFPEVRGERFVTEDVVWRAISRHYRTRFVNEPLRIYHRSDAGPTLTKTAPTSRAEGSRIHALDVLNRDIDWLRTVPLVFVRTAANFVRYSLHRRVGLGAQLDGLHNWRARILWAAAVPVGLALYWRDRLRA
jgi:glycosyltransferase involved in cell wall biosynthesis